jgi:hypothetical protein
MRNALFAKKKNGDMQTSSKQLRKAVCCANKKAVRTKKKKKWKRTKTQKRKTQKHKKRERKSSQAVQSCFIPSSCVTVRVSV